MNLRLKIALLQKGMKQKDLARIVRKSDASISRWIRGISVPNDEDRRIVGLVLQEQEGELFGDETKVSERP